MYCLYSCKLIVFQVLNRILNQFYPNNLIPNNDVSNVVIFYALQQSLNLLLAFLPPSHLNQLSLYFNINFLYILTGIFWKFFQVSRNIKGFFSATSWNFFTL